MAASPKNGQSIRIKKAIDKRIAANDRESLWWLNILDIPSVDKSQTTENTAILNLAIRSRFKFFWRPIGLGDRQNAESKMEFIATSDGITLVNPTPFFITVVDVVSASGNGLLKESIMVAPKSKTKVNSKQKIKPGEAVVLQAVNDYGSVVEFKTAINK
ncbi:MULTISPECIES: fimbrial biogenesis chaperone [unclassified Citrobacter]|uniref:fimbrial biogenesis chaperone n=1 Tax=unclassified Citrobacter TaxID=2644389 RepID=UPI002E11DE36|nr:MULTISPECIES: molecular chaperone [unclassified Citrobacter]